MEGEQTIREDERQACWEDFVQLLNLYKQPGSGGVKTLLKKVKDNGWKDLGTGDGKPMRRQENSEVNRWLKVSAWKQIS